MTRYLILTLTAMLCLISLVPAQTRIEGQAILSGSRGLGYTGLSYGAGIRSVSRFSSRWGSDLRLSVLASPKAQTHDGTSIQADLLGRFYLRPVFYAGGGIWIGKARTSLYSKLDAAVVGTAGYERNLYNLEGRFDYGLNENRQRVFSVGGDIPVLRKGSCYGLVGGSVLSDWYKDFFGSPRSGVRFEARLSGGCKVGRN